MEQTDIKQDKGKGRVEPFQGDLFLCNIPNWPVKDDIASMEVPIFSISKNPDTSIREYENGNTYVKIVPNALGCATIFDKDLLLYAGSQIIEARNRGKKVSPIVEVTTTDFLLKTARGNGRASYERIFDMLMRLYGTSIARTIKDGNERQTTPFSLIENFHIKSKKTRTVEVEDARGKTTEKQVWSVTSFQVKLSDWLYDGLMNCKVLTLDNAYFRLTSAISRRIYEIARKHCGNQAMWKINIDALAHKIGIKGERYRFREDIRRIIKDDAIPDYRLALDTSTKPDSVVFYTRDSGSLSKRLLQNLEETAWFEGLEKHKP
ncbi:MAG: replication initiator protein A [Azoarcus sp.]|jgi:plasmid replication initiation protein|nr:replication initiator protein A [Azoarcus sp.]